MTELEMRILEVAEQLFLERGFAGTSTTDIAREAGCNQALVHYYYRTKERLFAQIFLSKVDSVLEYIDHYTYNGDFFGCLRQLIDFYFDFINHHRRLPFLILNELATNHDRRLQMREFFVENPQRQRVYFAFDEVVKQEVEKGTIRHIETFDLLINVVSLVAMTFLTLPALQDMLQKSEPEVDTYLNKRKEEICLLLAKGLSAD